MQCAHAGVAFDVRRLNVGDFTWIAREKATPLPGWLLRTKITLNCGDCSQLAGQLGLPVSREVVLEHIVERKRIDDLAGSIVDGRFAEQKVCSQYIIFSDFLPLNILQFRLRNCGVRHPVYLIEEYGDSAHLKMPLRLLIQAVANTQVHTHVHCSLDEILQLHRSLILIWL